MIPSAAQLKAGRWSMTAKYELTPRQTTDHPRTRLAAMKTCIYCGWPVMRYGEACEAHRDLPKLDPNVKAAAVRREDVSPNPRRSDPAS